MSSCEGEGKKKGGASQRMEGVTTLSKTIQLSETPAPHMPSTRAQSPVSPGLCYGDKPKGGPDLSTMESGLRTSTAAK